MFRPAFEPPERVVRSFAEFAQRIHSERPLDGGAKIDLRVQPLSLERGWCGDDGRIIPTRQQLCPKCGGCVERISDNRLAAMRRFWRFLIAC